MLFEVKKTEKEVVTLSDLKTKGFSVRNMVLIALFAALSAVSAFLKIPMPEPFMPFTLQTMVVVLAGLILGSNNGALSQLLYVVIGLIGIPIFAGGGGFAYALKPSFGFLLGFIVAAYAVGRVREVLKKPSFIGYLAAALVSLVIIYIIGVIYMYFILTLYLGKDMTLWAAFGAGMVPYILPDIVKCIVAALLAYRLVPILQKQNLL